MTWQDALATTVRQDWGRLVALLLAQFRRLDLVEDAPADAVEAGARTWPRDGVPERPAAWLLTAARRRVLDRLRAEAMAARKEPLLVVDAEAAAARTGCSRADPGDLVGDEVLRLVLMCCHPALAPVRLVRVTLALAPDAPALLALLALLLLQHSRRDARVDAAGRLVLLPDQDRSRWHHGEVAEALDVLSRMPPAAPLLRARPELPPAGPGGGRARERGNGIRHPVGPDL